MKITRIMHSIPIGNRIVSDNTPAYIIAEMSSNHNQNLQTALEMIRSAKRAGADAIKTQAYTPDMLTIDCDNDYFKITSGLWKGKTLYDLYSESYTPMEWQPILKDEADRVGIDFISSPFHPDAVSVLSGLDIAAYKIASFELNYTRLLESAAKRMKPIILSVGMATVEEIGYAVKTIMGTGNTMIALLECTSAYPTNNTDLNLDSIRDMKDRFGCVVGLSDHSTSSMSPSIAVALGARIIEKHIKCDEVTRSADSAFSLSPSQFSEMVENIRNTETMIGSGRYGCGDCERDSIKYRRSIVVVKDIKAGERFTDGNIKAIRPGYGMSPALLDRITDGGRSLCDIRRGTPLVSDMVQE